MSVELDGRVIRGLDINAKYFRNKWKDLPDDAQAEGSLVIQSLLFKNVDQLFGKLHFHPLTNQMVESRLDAGKKVKAWSLHITANDGYKASFTFEDGVLYFRTCGVHDKVDKSP